MYVFAPVFPSCYGYLGQTASSSYLLSVPYRSQSQSLDGLNYAATNTHGKSTVTKQFASAPSDLDLSNAETMKHYVKHTFPEGPSWTPERLEVNGRKGRRAVCVVAEDRIHYRIFDIDTPKAEGEVGQDAMTEDSEMAMEDTPPV